MKKNRENILMFISGISLVSNIVFINLFAPAYKALVPIGFIILCLGALLFVLSVIEHRKKRSTKIINKGIYRFVRNPMYLGAILMFFSHIFFSQYWLVATGTILGIASVYITTVIEELKNIERFGEDYKKYMEKVPRMNIILGFIRYCKKI